VTTNKLEAKQLKESNILRKVILLLLLFFFFFFPVLLGTKPFLGDIKQFSSQPDKGE